MNNAIELKPGFRIFTLRILLLWMFIVFIFWMLSGQLPSQYLFNEHYKGGLPPVLKGIETGTLKFNLLLVEIFFTVTLLLALFIPQYTIIIALHFVSGLVLTYLMLGLKGGLYISLAGYLLLFVSFLFEDEKKFLTAFDFLQTSVLIIILFYAAHYFIGWYQYLKNPFLRAAINQDAENLSARDTLVKNIMPWFYIFFLVVCVRIFTNRFNKLLFAVIIVLLLLEYFLNTFFDPVVTFMLFPFINWHQLYYRFNKRFEPK